MHGSLLLFLSLALTLPAIARNITIDNESPQVVYSPPPCFQNNSTGCSTEWQRRLKREAFNGSVTLTAGSNSSQIPDVLPRVSLTFRGTGIVFMPGMWSSAQATVVVDDRPSVFLNTSESAFEGIGLDPQRNHTISVTFVPEDDDDSLTLDVDYFLVTQPDVEPTSTTSSSLFTTALPTILPPTNTAPVPTATPTPRALSQSGVPTGTIAAISLSGALVLVLGILLCLCAARRRRRRVALRRERAILYDLHLPSERQGRNRRESVWRAAWRDSYAGAMAWRNSYAGASAREKGISHEPNPREKGKAREPDPPPSRPESELLEWRIASPPPASLRVGRAHSAEYTPWP